MGCCPVWDVPSLPTALVQGSLAQEEHHPSPPVGQSCPQMPPALPGAEKNIYFLLSTRVVAFCHLLTCCGNGSSCEFPQKGLVVPWLWLTAHPASAEPSPKPKARVNTARGTLTVEQHVFDQLSPTITPSLPYPLSTSCFILPESKNMGEIVHLACKTKPGLLPLLSFLQFSYFFPLPTLPGFGHYPRDLP